MCDESSRGEKRKAKNIHDEFYANPSFIVKKSFFRYIKGHPRNGYDVTTWPEPHQYVYPKASTYYAFHEDTNPFTRVNIKQESRKYGNVQAHFEPPKEVYTVRDPYYENEAKRKYLGSTPTCFVILGKPDLNTAKLAKMIADSWHCVLISPLALVKQEIEQGTERGNVLNDILKRGHRLGPQIVLNLIADRLNRRDIFHRGYVVEGLPLIPNETIDYSSYPSLPDEQSNAKTIFQELKRFFDPSIQRMCGTTADLDEFSMLCDQQLKQKTCQVKPKYEDFIVDQIKDIFTVWPIKPSIIVYAMCPDADVAIKREYFRTDPTTGRVVDTSFVGMNRNIETLFSRDKEEKDMNISFELYQELMSEERMLDEQQRKYLLKRLPDRESNVELQCELYTRFALPVIDKWILLHNPQNVIRVDGRTPASRMFQIVVARLRTLSLPRVILPQKFSSRVELEGESPGIELLDEFQDKSNEDAFRDLANRETVSPMYPWQLSPWKFLCPVELTRGTTVEGTPKDTVRFMNNIFFLSSSEAVALFIDNPRTFLFPFSPRPTCKVAVFGPHYSGKSDLCRKLALALRGTVINVKEIDKSLANVDSDISIYSPNHVTLEESADSIVKSIQAIPKKEIDIEIWRDGDYIVDGLYPDVNNWKRIVEDSKIIFEDVVLLFDEDPYEYLTSRWQSIHDTEVSQYMEHEEYLENVIDRYEQDDEEDDEEEEKSQGLTSYLRHVRQFQLDWEKIRETVANACINLIACNLSTVKDVSDYVITRIKDRYTEKARVMSEEEKEREKDLAEYIGMTDTEDIDEEEQEGEAKSTELDVKEDIRRFGDTNYYCPVSLLRYNIFRKGIEDFGAVFLNKTYLLSSASTLEEFLSDPRKLNLPFRKPLPKIPQFRCSIIGPLGSGKSTMAEIICRKYGLMHIDHCETFTEYMKNRGMREVTDRDVIILPENFLEEVELPEDLEDKKYNYDEATMQTFVRRYWKIGGTLPKQMFQECVLKYFEGLYNEHGLVFDHFPSCPENVKDILKYHIVPELVIDLHCNKDKMLRRMLPILFATWKKRLEEKQRIENERYTKEWESYMKRKEFWVKENLNKMFNFGETEEAESDTYYSDEEIDTTREELEASWHLKHPEPVLFTDWEDFEDVKQRIERDFIELYEYEFEKLTATRIALEEESIPYVSVRADGDLEHVLLQILKIIEPYVRRNVSSLEKTYTLDLETAETLLDCGYYLPSSFGRWCPVQLHENNNPLQMYLPLEAQQEVYPVIHRQFVYFFGGKEARSAFLGNPFEYLEQDSCVPVVPFRLSIIGPPKCGKSSLARRFANKYGLKIITRGTALRHAIKHFPWTDSSRLMESDLRAGRLAPEKSISRSVEMYSIDPASTSQGFVLDGFPTSCKEYKQLTLLGVQPMVVLDLKANISFCLECLSQQTERTTIPINFSDNFLKHRYANWEISQGDYREWLKKFAQNVIEIDATKSSWYVWLRADQEVCSRYAHVRTYFRESDYDKAHALKFMNVSPYEFKIRQSGFESYCPACLKQNCLQSTGVPPDHRGMFQYRGHFYWICQRHTNDFLKNPQQHLPPSNTATLPEQRPRILTEIIDIEHYCWGKRLRVGGFCLVTYVENLPKRELVPGKPNLAVLYEDNLYLFCTEECRDKFLQYCDKYTSVNVKLLRTLSPIDISKLPNLGFLEQSMVQLIIDVVNEVSQKRPKITGLSCSVSAAIYMGVYLKAFANIGLNELEIYKEVGNRMSGYDSIVKTAISTMKKKRNPFISLPDYATQDNSSPRLSKQLSVLSFVLSHFSNSIMFRRTSPTQVLTDPNYDSDD